MAYFDQMVRGFYGLKQKRQQYERTGQVWAKVKCEHLFRRIKSSRNFEPFFVNFVFHTIKLKNIVEEKGVMEGVIVTGMVTGFSKITFQKSNIGSFKRVGFTLRHLEISRIRIIIIACNKLKMALERNEKRIK